MPWWLTTPWQSFCQLDEYSILVDWSRFVNSIDLGTNGELDGIPDAWEMTSAPTSSQ